MPRIIFLGTPEFAVPILDVLTKTPHEIVGVLTRQDKPAGRGGNVQASPIKQLALSRNLPIFQPKTLKRKEEIERLRELRPDLILVSAYGLILPREVLEIPLRGCINTHASLLPRHRGAAPIPAAILAGDEQSGVTLMRMDEGIDTGPIMVQRAIRIENRDTTWTLTAKLSRLAAELVIETMPKIFANEIIARPQDESHATYARTIKKDEGLIDWNLPSEEVARRVRAYNPWPSAYTIWNGSVLKILGAEPAASEANLKPGTVIRTGDEITVTCGKGKLVLREVQLAGKRAMGVEEFVRGRGDFVGSLLSH
jgi:methionyl-tRNA formyltransferase